MKHYIAEKWRDILVFNDLDSYEKVWALKADWFEEPNYRQVVGAEFLGLS